MSELKLIDKFLLFLDGSRTMRDLFKLYSERVYGKKYDLVNIR